MTPQSLRPVRVIFWGLATLSTRESAEAAVGDLLEELEQRRATERPVGWPRVWLNVRAAGLLTAATARSTERAVRAASRTFRDAFRALRRAPLPTLFILLVLTAGISAATVTFSVADAVMLRPLPFDRSQDIVVVGGRSTRSATGLTPEEFWAIHRRATTLDSLSPFGTRQTRISSGSTTTEMTVTFAMADLFRVLRVAPLVGRVWTRDDEAHHRTDVAVLSHSLWRRQFNEDPSVIGASLADGTRVLTIIGVLPPEAVFPSARGNATDIWVPRIPAQVSASPTWGRDVFALGRLQSRASLADARTEIQGLIAPLVDPSQYRYEGWRTQVERWDVWLVGDPRNWLLLLLGAVTLMMLIACFNAANFMVARAAVRVREMSVRAALGASRLQLGMSLLAESLLLSLSAAICSLAIAYAVVRGVAKMLPVALFRAEAIAVNGRVFAAAMVAALVTGVIFGTVPAWQASRASVSGVLKDGGSTVTVSRRTWRHVFLTAEVACVAALLVISTLFVTSFVRIATLDLGFKQKNLIAVATVTNYRGTVDDLQAHFAGVRGIGGAAAVTSSSPPLIGSAFGGAWSDSRLRPVGANRDVPDRAEIYRVSANYFEIAAIPFRRGSTWTAADAANGSPVVIDDRLAKELFGDADPIGKEVHARDLKDAVLRVVGVVPFVFARGPEGSQRSSAYLAMRPNARPSWVSFLLRTTAPPETLAPSVTSAIAAVAPPEPSPGAGVSIVQDGFGVLTRARRFNAGLMTVFGVLSLLIGAAGIYAVVAAVVAQQTREIGVRTALGATSADIRRGVLSMAARPIVGGLAIGLPTAAWITRSFAAMFFGVSPADPEVYVTVAVIIGVVGLVAAIGPAHAASRIDPVVSLRKM